MKTLLASLTLWFVLASSCPARLPNECALIATEASMRMHAMGIWTEILFVDFQDGEHHAYCIFAPYKEVMAYDDTGTFALAIRSRLLPEILKALAAATRRPIQGGRFIE